MLCTSFFFRRFLSGILKTKDRPEKHPPRLLLNNHSYRKVVVPIVRSALTIFWTITGTGL
jgi:hypothetical protein